MTYGVTATGFQRKPLPIILAEIEAQLVTEFGPEVVQTPQSPLGQVNGLMTDIITELWEFLEDVYQSYDPDQAEGNRLDILAKLRLLQRAGGEMDDSFRQAITNADRARNDVQDLARAVQGVNGVTYSQVFVNDSNATDANGMPSGTVAVAVLGGDDEEIASQMRRFIVPGVTTYGNLEVSTNEDGYCRSLRVIRPILVPVKLQVDVRLGKDFRGCPPPSSAAIRSALLEGFAGSRMLLNGDDLTYFRIRSVIEAAYQNVEVVRFAGERDGLPQSANAPVEIAFIEIATLALEDVTINVLAPEEGGLG
ncbi:tail protein [Aminobacter phage Erebus]|nr:tail protein [Aminobacter phage Erebus]